MLDPQFSAESVLGDHVFPRRGEPGYEQFLQAFQQGVQWELCRLWEQGPLSSPGHRLQEDNHESAR